MSKKQSQKEPHLQDLREELLKKCALLDELKRHPGFKILSNDLEKEILEKYKQLANGTKEDFDENKGYLKGINRVFKVLESYDNKRKQLNQEKK